MNFQEFIIKDASMQRFDSGPLFNLGRVTLTPEAADLLTPREIIDAVIRHGQGKWGDVLAAIWHCNEIAVKEPEGQLLSMHVSGRGFTFYVGTDYFRAETEISLPPALECSSFKET
jgi:hypothetical protein